MPGVVLQLHPEVVHDRVEDGADVVRQVEQDMKDHHRHQDDGQLRLAQGRLRRQREDQKLLGFLGGPAFESQHPENSKQGTVAMTT